MKYMAGINVSEDAHDELRQQKSVVADVLDVPESKVTFEDALRTFMYPVGWTGVDAETIRGR